MSEDLAAERHELVYLSVDLLVPNSWNPQDQDELTFNRLVEEVKTTGFVDPIEVVALKDETYRILGGEHRWLAAKAAELDEVPCVVLKGARWNDEDFQKFVTVRLNTIKGKINPERFLKLYQEMAGKYGADALQDLMGFVDHRSFNKLVDGVKKGMKQSLPPEMSAEFDDKAKEAETVEDLQKIIQTLFSKYGDTVKQSFMIFTHGRQEHLYIAMDNKMSKAMKKVTEYCKHTGTDINKFMAPITDSYIKEATKKLAEAKKIVGTSEAEEAFRK